MRVQLAQEQARQQARQQAQQQAQQQARQQAQQQSQHRAQKQSHRQAQQEAQQHAQQQHQEPLLRQPPSQKPDPVQQHLRHQTQPVRHPRGNANNGSDPTKPTPASPEEPPEASSTDDSPQSHPPKRKCESFDEWRAEQAIRKQIQQEQKLQRSRSRQSQQPRQRQQEQQHQQQHQQQQQSQQKPQHRPQHSQQGRRSQPRKKQQWDEGTAITESSMLTDELMEDQRRGYQRPPSSASRQGPLHYRPTPPPVPSSVRASSPAYPLVPSSTFPSSSGSGSSSGGGSGNGERASPYRTLDSSRRPRRTLAVSSQLARAASMDSADEAAVPPPRGGGRSGAGSIAERVLLPDVDDAGDYEDGNLPIRDDDFGPPSSASLRDDDGPDAAGDAPNSELRRGEGEATGGPLPASGSRPPLSPDKTASHRMESVRSRRLLWGGQLLQSKGDEPEAAMRENKDPPSSSEGIRQGQEFEPDDFDPDEFDPDEFNPDDFDPKDVAPDELDTDHTIDGQDQRHEEESKTRGSGLSMVRLVENALQEATWKNGAVQDFRWKNSPRNPKGPTTTAGSSFGKGHSPSLRWPPTHPDSRPPIVSPSPRNAAPTASKVARMRDHFAAVAAATPSSVTSSPARSRSEKDSGIDDSCIDGGIPMKQYQRSQEKQQQQRGSDFPGQSPTRSDHSADAAAGAKFGRQQKLEDVRKRIFGPMGNAQGIIITDKNNSNSVAGTVSGERNESSPRVALQNSAGLNLDVNKLGVEANGQRGAPAPVSDRIIAQKVSWEAEGQDASQIKAAVSSSYADMDEPSIVRKVSWDEEHLDSIPEVGESDSGHKAGGNNKNKGFHHTRADTPPSVDLEAKLAQIDRRSTSCSATPTNRSVMSPTKSVSSAMSPTKSVASAQPSVESACVRQNAAIAVEMEGAMMDFFYAADEREGNCVYNHGDDESTKESESHQVLGDATKHAYTSLHQLEPQAAGMPRIARCPTGQQNKLGTAVGAKPPNPLMIPVPSREFDDPSVFDNSLLTMMSDSSSEMTPALAPPKPATSLAAKNQLDTKLVKRDLSLFLGQFSDQILRGCNDRDAESSDVFLAGDSEFGQSSFAADDVCQRNMESGQPKTKQGPPSLNQAVPLSRVGTLNRATLLDEKENLDDDSIFSDDPSDRQRQPPGAPLPPASTFLSAKDRARIRQHDTTPLRTNTSRARRMRVAGGMHGMMRPHSYGDAASMSSIQEVPDDDASDCSTTEEGPAPGASNQAPSDMKGGINEAGGQHYVSSKGDRKKSGPTAQNGKDPADDVPEKGDNQSSLDPPSSFDDNEERRVDDQEELDLVKMTFREKSAKGHSLAWNSSNGVNEDELFDSKQLPPSRAKTVRDSARVRAAGLAGRLSLLSISVNSAGAFRQHFNARRKGVSPLYDFVADDEYKTGVDNPSLGFIREERSSEGDDDESSETDGEGEYTHDNFVQDFKDFVADDTVRSSKAREPDIEDENWGERHQQRSVRRPPFSNSGTTKGPTTLSVEPDRQRPSGSPMSSDTLFRYEPNQQRRTPPLLPDPIPMKDQGSSTSKFACQQRRTPPLLPDPSPMKHQVSSSSKVAPNKKHYGANHQSTRNNHPLPTSSSNPPPPPPLQPSSTRQQSIRFQMHQDPISTLAERKEALLRKDAAKRGGKARHWDKIDAGLTIPPTTANTAVGAAALYRKSQTQKQHYHPHHVPRDKEMSKTRLEEKLRGCGVNGAGKKDCSNSVGTSELGSLLTKDSDRSRLNGLPVPSMIFHRTHPSLTEPDSARSSPSSMQNTYNASFIVSGGTPSKCEETKACSPCTPDGDDLTCTALSEEIASQVKILLPDEEDENALALQDVVLRCPEGTGEVVLGNQIASHHKRSSASTTNQPMTRTKRYDRRDHLKVKAADAIAKIDEELLRSNGQRLPSHTFGAVREVPARPVGVSSRPPVRPQPKLDPNKTSSEEKNDHQLPSVSKYSVMSTDANYNMTNGKALVKDTRREQTTKEPKTYDAKGPDGTLKTTQSPKKTFHHRVKIVTKQPEWNRNTTGASSSSFRKTDSMPKWAQTTRISKDNFPRQHVGPASVNNSYLNSRRNKVGTDETSHHSSIFEAFEVAPLETVVDNNSRGVGDMSMFGVHHSYVKKGAKKVGFPAPPGDRSSSTQQKASRSSTGIASQRVTTVTNGNTPSGRVASKSESKRPDESESSGPNPAFEVMLQSRHLDNQSSPKKNKNRVTGKKISSDYEAMLRARNSSRNESVSNNRSQPPFAGVKNVPSTNRKSDNGKNLPNGNMKQRIRTGWKKVTGVASSNNDDVPASVSNQVRRANRLFPGSKSSSFQNRKNGMGR